MVQQVNALGDFQVSVKDQLWWYNTECLSPNTKESDNGTKLGEIFKIMVSNFEDNFSFCCCILATQWCKNGSYPNQFEAKSVILHIHDCTKLHYVCMGNRQAVWMKLLTITIIIILCEL